MKVASLAEIKKELITLSSEQLLQICLDLSKYKKENKEYLNYLLFESNDENIYLDKIKAEMEEMFTQVNSRNHYLAKKTIRKTLKFANCQIKYSKLKTTEISIIIYFCTLIKSHRGLMDNQIIQNIVKSQFAKIQKLMGQIHEDQRLDYEDAIEQLQIQ